MTLTNTLLISLATIVIIIWAVTSDILIPKHLIEKSILHYLIFSAACFYLAASSFILCICNFIDMRFTPNATSIVIYIFNYP